jgi:hypothetical protein
MTLSTFSLPLAGAPDRQSLERARLLLLLPAAGLIAFCLQQTGIDDVVRRLVLPDTDDAMRLVVVRDLLAGQPWFDNVQHRYLPPSGAPMHWSRLIDLALAGAMAGLAPLLGEPLSQGLVAAIWPPAIFLAFLAVVWTGTRRLFGFEAACFAVLVATQLPISGLFAVGRIDHHNIQALAILVVALCVADPAPGRRGGLLAGTAAALSLAIGLETFPFVALLGVAAVLRWVLNGDRLALPLEGFGGALAAGSLALFALQTAPSAWATPECDALSSPWLILAAGGGLGSVLLSRNSGRLRDPTGRLLGALALGLALTGAFLWHSPQCAAGPFAAMPLEVRAGWLDRVLEVMPLWTMSFLNPAGAFTVAVPLAGAIVAAIVGALRHQHEARQTFVVFAAFLALCGVITLVHLRGFYVGSVLIPVIGGRVFANALRAESPARRAGLLATAIVFLGQIVATPVLLAQERLRVGQNLTRGQAPKDCASPESLAALRGLPSGLVLAPVDLGPALLLYTRHAIIAGPYHRLGDGILAGLAVERGTPAQLAQAIGRFRPDYVALCASAVNGNTPGSAAMALAGGDALGWLQPTEIQSGALKVWRVAPHESASPQLRP